MPLTMNTPSRQKFGGEVQLRKGSADTPTWVTTSSSFLNSGGTRKTQRFRARHTLFYLQKPDTFRAGRTQRSMTSSRLPTEPGGTIISSFGLQGG
mmetsp:Transcript_7006/g.30783  ORF Transcript_7006/g.30783 Transcript_7006/m.30783 type:complete len:95 (-) Transcript_7006:498-782(-)